MKLHRVLIRSIFFFRLVSRNTLHNLAALIEHVDKDIGNIP